MGFDPDELGFPSIQGCHAIVYQTMDGLYGFHNAGGSGDQHWAPRAKMFREFINDLNGLRSSGTRLYGCSFIGNNQRGFATTMPAHSKWMQELLAFAQELGYHGKISGYDLARTFKGNHVSAYVEYRRDGTKSDVWIRQWGQPSDPTRLPKVPNARDLKHRYLANTSLQDLKEVVDPQNGVNRNGLTKISKQKLR